MRAFFQSRTLEAPCSSPFNAVNAEAIFDGEGGQIMRLPEAQRPPLEHPIGCPRCGQRSLHEVWLTEVGQTQLSAAVLSP